MQKEKKGFGVIEVVLVIVIVGLLGVIGWMLYDKQQDHTDSTANSAQQVEQSETVPAVVELQYTLDNAVGDINKTLASQSCDGSGAGQVVKADFNVVDGTAPFDYQGGKSIINNDLTFAFTQYGCGSQGSVGLLKKTDAGWVLVSENARIYPLCTEVRGQGFPVSVVDKCYADDNAADPEAI